ncbi:MAG: amylo-alpha-1,6-glucosidase [Victivallaceae bacterium]
MQFKVEPACNVCGNSIYTAFPRQFGPDIAGRVHHPGEEDAVKLLENKGYNVIPPSGTFRDVARRMDFITGELHSRIIQLLPIHPVPTTYGRMGRFGSPFASLDYFAVDPALAEFDNKTTPLEQFLELVDAAHARSARIFLDIPVNHTGWASRLHLEHPEWFVREDDRSFVSPGAWGVVWADLCKLDYHKYEVHKLMADVFLYWCRKGVDGFRCDAGYMLPQEAWQYINARVRREYPNTIFLLEGLGGPNDVQENLLKTAGLNWAYSELFQNYTREQIENYFPYTCRMSLEAGIFINFAETHDNLRLAAKSECYARMRTALCALLAHNGAFGITNGVEWLAPDRIDVHGAEPLNWGSKDNQVAAIRRLQLLLENHPAFHAGAEVKLIHKHSDNALAALRISWDRAEKLLILVNLDDEKTSLVQWSSKEFDCAGTDMVDLLTGAIIQFDENKKNRLELAPGQALCLSANVDDLKITDFPVGAGRKEPERIIEQRIRAEALTVWSALGKHDDVSELDIAQLCQSFTKDPVAFCVDAAAMEIPPLVTWRDGVDQHRTVMLPPGSLLLVRSQYSFRAEIKNGKVTEYTGTSLPLQDGGYFLIFPSVKFSAPSARYRQLKMKVFDETGCHHTGGILMLLPEPGKVSFRMAFSHDEIKRHDYYALFSNNLGGMAQIRADWGSVRSKYDAILAANCNPDYPVDRRVMFTRCRGWLVCKEYSQEINLSCLERFVSGVDNQARWELAVAAGQGKNASLHISMEFAENSDAVRMIFYRPPSELDSETALEENETVKIILRPDIEDRCNHEVTKAFTGPEKSFPASITTLNNGFSFNPPSGYRLELKLDGASFTLQPEWHYMIPLPVEKERGLESHTDLFSPGYFEFQLKSGETRELLACASGNNTAASADNLSWPKINLAGAVAPETTLFHGIKRFIAKRDQYHTVIAGYPWFLDWGRDTLICLRGMIAAGYVSESRDIIKQFAKFEKNGTIPNMIRGNDDSNRDTSDAPLWIFTAVADFIREVESDEILRERCGGRTLLAVLESIAENYLKGAANGIKMDPESGLIFSPSHFTWMDTNYPAGTPRQGYPVEIQALWFAALKFLSRHNNDWKLLAEKVSKSIEKYFWLPEKKRLSDCLHADSGTPASRAVADDACRPNQLLAVTLGAVSKREIKLGIIRSCEQLLVPGAIRSLADQKVDYPLPVSNNGKLLNSPEYPYWGKYTGDEDSRRKPAYHNGTAWTWPFPSYCEALFLVGGERCRTHALALLLSCQGIIESGTPGQVPEILDGNSPHMWRGCGAQAWGITELYRICRLLSNGSFLNRS